MATIQRIFDMAIHLMDEQSEDSGATLHQDTQEYKFRSISILNSVIPALSPYSGQWYGRDGAAVLHPGNFQNPNMEQEIPLDDTLSYALLPYYLAGMLLAGENRELSETFLNRYNTAFYDLRGKNQAEFESIRPIYGLF